MTPNENTALLIHTQAAIRTQGRMGKYPYWTKIVLYFLLIPAEQVLLFKGPNPLQSIHWNLSTVSPLSLCKVCAFALFFPPLSFFSAFPWLWVGKQKHSALNELWKCAWGKPLKKLKFSPPFLLREPPPAHGIFKHNGQVALHAELSYFLCTAKQSNHKMIANINSHTCDTNNSLLGAVISFKGVALLFCLGSIALIHFLFSL